MNQKRDNNRDHQRCIGQPTVSHTGQYGPGFHGRKVEMLVLHTVGERYPIARYVMPIPTLQDPGNDGQDNPRDQRNPMCDDIPPQRGKPIGSVQHNDQREDERNDVQVPNKDEQ